MKDESEEETETGKTRKKIEYSSETHFEVLSDKKVEIYESTDFDVSPKVKKVSPKQARKQTSFKTSKPTDIPQEQSVPSSDKSQYEKSEKSVFTSSKTFKSSESKSTTDTHILKSTGLVKQAASSQPRETGPKPSKTVIMKPVQTVKETTLPKTIQRQDKIGVVESGSETEIFHEQVTPKVFQPKEPQIISKHKIEFRTQPQVQHLPQTKPVIATAQPPKLQSPELKPEPKPEHGFVEPPRKPSLSNAFGVESTKITKIADSSQYHKRFVTMQQTTRLIKFGEEKPQKSEHEKPRERSQSVEISTPKPLPQLEPFPFKPGPEKPKRERGPPPPTPKKFQKGDFRDSDYDSDYEGRIKVRWQPQDSDVEDEPLYTRVRAPSSDRTHSKSIERIPTPPTTFDVPPELSGQLRPTVEPIEKPISMPKIEKIPQLKKKVTPKPIVKPKSPSPPPKEPSPELPPPGTPPEEGVIVQEIQYVVDKVDCKTRIAPLQMVQQETFEQKPYVEISERTHKTVIDEQMREELRFNQTRNETVETVVTEDEDIAIPVDIQNMEVDTPDEKPALELEPFPFEPEPSKPKRQRGPPPPKPKKFVKYEFRESDYDSDFDGKIKPKWQPPDSDAEDLAYSKIKVPSPSPDRRGSKSQERVPTPPSKFETPPPVSGVLRPSIDRVVDISNVIQVETTPEIEISFNNETLNAVTKSITKTKVKQEKSKEVKIEKTPQPPKQPSPPLPEPGPKPVIGYAKPKIIQQEEKEDVSIKMIQKKVSGKKGIEIDIDITDIYDYSYDSESDKNIVDKTVMKPFPTLEPFPFEPEPSKPKRQKGPPPPMPKKFTKGEVRGSDYESDYEGKIPPRWAPPDSEGEDLSYRRVAPSLSKGSKQSSESLSRDDPSPPSKFDQQPPQYEGPPRPVVDLDSLPRRERRESLEEYFIPKFPKIEFKPFDLGDEEEKKKSIKTSAKEETTYENQQSYSETTQSTYSFK